MTTTYLKEDSRKKKQVSFNPVVTVATSCLKSEEQVSFNPVVTVATSSSKLEEQVSPTFKSEKENLLISSLPLPYISGKSDPLVVYPKYLPQRLSIDEIEKLLLKEKPQQYFVESLEKQF